MKIAAFGRRVLCMVMYRLGFVPKADADRQMARAGSIIEEHIDAETWLLGLLGIDEPHRVRAHGMIDREKVLKYFGT